MDGLVIIFVAAQASALAVALGIASSRGRSIEAIDEALRDAEGGAAHELLVKPLTRDVDGAETVGAPVPAKMRERIGKPEVETGNIAQMVAELRKVTAA